MDGDQWMQAMEMPLLCAAGFLSFYGIGLLLAGPVGLLIGHTLMLFPAFRRYMENKSIEESCQRWKQDFSNGFRMDIYVRIGDGENRLVRTIDVGASASDAVNPSETPEIHKVSELEKLKNEAQAGVSDESETSQQKGVPDGEGDVASAASEPPP